MYEYLIFIHRQSFLFVFRSLYQYTEHKTLKAQIRPLKVSSSSHIICYAIIGTTESKESTTGKGNCT